MKCDLGTIKTSNGKLAETTLSLRGVTVICFLDSYLQTTHSVFALKGLLKRLPVLCFKLSVELIKRERGCAHGLCLALGNFQVVNSILIFSFQPIKVFNFILTLSS